MKKITLLFALMFAGLCSEAQLMSQASINPQDSVVLYPPWSFESFSTVEVGAVVPDFQTLDVDGYSVIWNDVRQQCTQQEKAIMMVYGSLSCPALVNLMNEVSLTVAQQREEDVKVIHLLPTIEAHASNGYVTPWWGEYDGQPFIPDQIPTENEGLHLPQSFTMGEYWSRAQNFVSDLNTMFGVPWYSEATILLDSPESHWTQWFGGPAGLAIIDPLTGEVMYSASFILCGMNGHEQCPSIYAIIDNIISHLVTVDIDDPNVSSGYVVTPAGVHFDELSSGYVTNMAGQTVYEFSNASEIYWKDLSTRGGLYVVSVEGGLTVKVMN